MDVLSALLREALAVTALLAIPLLGALAAVGLIVAVLQAATQVQEQTLGLLPKVLLVAAATATFGGTALGSCARLFHDAVVAAPALARAGP